MVTKKRTTKKKRTVPRVLGLYGGKKHKRIPHEHDTPEGRYYLIQTGYDVEGLKGWEKSAERWYGKAKFKIIKLYDEINTEGKKMPLYGLYRMRE